MARPEKVAVVESLSRVFKEAKSVVLNDFTGLNVGKISQLRRLCREQGVDYVVVKNTLAKRSVQGTELEGLSEFMEGPTALAVSRESENIPAKILAEFAKENEAPKFKAALVAGQILAPSEVAALAKLPTREEMISQLLGGIKAPANQLASVLQGTLRKLLYALNAIIDRGGAGSNPQEKTD